MLWSAKRSGNCSFLEWHWSSLLLGGTFTPLFFVCKHKLGGQKNCRFLTKKRGSILPPPRSSKLYCHSVKCSMTHLASGAAVCCWKIQLKQGAGEWGTYPASGASPLKRPECMPHLPTPCYATGSNCFIHSERVLKFLNLSRPWMGKEGGKGSW